MIFFCKIIEFFCPNHPDRLSQRYASREALWVATSANAKNFNILQRTCLPAGRKTNMTVLF